MSILVNAPVINLYADAHEESEVVSQALYGWPVCILEERSYFRRIQTSDQYEGWVFSWSLYRNSSMSSLPHGRMAKVIHNAAHLYASPSVKSQKPLLTLPFEVKLKIILEPEEEDFRWLQVELVNGSLAWIQRGNVQLSPPALTLSQVLDLSTQFLGLPYTWGGISSFGYDCSGFVQMLFRQMQTSLPRDTRLQVNSPLCEEIPLNELSKGDLVFFGASPDRIQHVALYLGDQELIHASVKPIPVLQKTHLEDHGLKQRFSYWTARKVKIA